MKKLFTLLLIVVALSAQANVPGYQGHRFSIIYDPAIMHPYLVGKYGKAPMIFHNATVDYVVSRGFSIGLKYGYMFYKCPQKGLNTQDYSQLAGFKERYTQHTVAFQVKRFYHRKGYIAPVGRYFTFGLYYQYMKDRRAEIDYDYYYSQVKAVKAIGHNGGLIIGMGRNFIVGHRFIIDFGFNLNLSPAMFGDNYGTQNQAKSNMAFRNIFQVYIGFGGLVF